MSSEADTVPVQTAQQRPSRGRAIAAGLCLVLAGLLTIPAATAYWGQRTLNDTQRYLDTVGPLVDSPEVQDASPRRSPMRSSAGGHRGAHQPGVRRGHHGAATAGGPGRPHRRRRQQVRREPGPGFIASDTFAEFWVTANTRAQIALVRLLKGDQSGAVTLQDNQVVLDVSQVIDAVKTRLGRPRTDRARNVPIPDKDRQIVLLDAPQLKQARTIYAFTNPVAQWASSWSPGCSSRRSCCPDAGRG